MSLIIQQIFIYIVAVFCGICWAIWPSLFHVKAVIRARVPEVLFNIYFALGVCVCSLLLLPLAKCTFVITTYGLLSGVLLVTGSCLVFVTTRKLGLATGYSLSITVSMATRLMWDVVYLHESTHSMGYVVSAACLLFIALQMTMRIHHTNLRVGTATIKLDSFGVKDISQFMLQGTSVHSLKHNLWMKFWEEDIDIGDPNQFYLQYLDGPEDEKNNTFADLDRIDMLPKKYQNITLRIVPLVSKESSFKGLVLLLCGFNGKKVSDDPNGSEDLALLEENDDDSSKKSFRAHELEIGRRLQRIEPISEKCIDSQIFRKLWNIRFYYIFAMLAGLCLGTIDVPALRSSDSYTEGHMLAYFPVMGIGAILVSPTLPMHDSCASCASYHLSRQCNISPSIPHSSSVLMLGTAAGALWICNALAAVYCATRSQYAIIFLIMAIAHGVNTYLGVSEHREFERGAAFLQGLTFLLVAFAGVALTFRGTVADFSAYE